jgi:hypothetical protein
MLALVVLLPTALGDPTPLPHRPGDGLVRVRDDALLALWAYDDDGNLVHDGHFAKETLSIEGEAGVAPHLTLDATVPAIWIPQRGVSLGDFDIGGIFTVLESPVTLAISADVKAPLYAAKPSVLGRDAKTREPAFGDGQTDVTGQGLFVAELPYDGAMDLYAGYRFRGGTISDCIVGGGRIGLWTFDRRVFWSAVLDTAISLAPAPTAVRSAGYADFGPRVSLRVADHAFVDVSALYVGRGQNSVGGYLVGAGASLQF